MTFHFDNDLQMMNDIEEQLGLVAGEFMRLAELISILSLIFLLSLLSFSIPFHSFPFCSFQECPALTPTRTPVRNVDMMLVKPLIQTGLKFIEFLL